MIRIIACEKTYNLEKYNTIKEVFDIIKDNSIEVEEGVFIKLEDITCIEKFENDNPSDEDILKAYLPQKGCRDIYEILGLKQDK